VACFLPPGSERLIFSSPSFAYVASLVNHKPSHSVQAETTVAARVSLREYCVTLASNDNRSIE
jgi:hypothetical protein